MNDKTRLPTVDENPERCETCRYWELAEENTNCGDIGICRRYPPQPDVQFCLEYGKQACELSDWWSQPYTPDCSWCGEWRAKRPAPDLPRPGSDAA